MACCELDVVFRWICADLVLSSVVRSFGQVHHSVLDPNVSEGIHRTVTRDTNPCGLADDPRAHFPPSGAVLTPLHQALRSRPTSCESGVDLIGADRGEECTPVPSVRGEVGPYTFEQRDMLLRQRLQCSYRSSTIHSRNTIGAIHDPRR
jgi:hypothetical protein